MKKVLLLTIVFPPEGGGGTIRVSKIAKYLPKFGWELSVVTAKPPQGTAEKPGFPGVCVRRAPRCDVTGPLVGVVAAIRSVAGMVRRLLRRDAHVGRAAAESAHSAGRTPHARRLADYVFIPDDRVVWVPLALILGVWEVLRGRPSIIYSTSPSPSTHLVGYCLVCLTKLPWVIEFRDPWMLNPFRIPRPLRWMEDFEGWLEKKVLHKATHVVVTSMQYKRDFLMRYPLIRPEDVSYIPNGFDPEDFENISSQKYGRFTIVHSGTFYEARSPVPFLEAVAIAVEREPRLRGQFQVVFVGQRDPMTTEAVERLSLSDIVMQTGIVDHRRSLEYMTGADLLLLVPGPGDGTMPGKVYEYLAARKPILALADEGAVSSLIVSTGTGVVVQPEDASGIVEAIISMYNSGGSHDTISFRYKGNDQVLKQFDRREIAGSIASLLDRLAASH